MTLSLDHARTIIAATRAKGRDMELKPLSVVVLDAGGHVLAFEREDRAAPRRAALRLRMARPMVPSCWAWQDARRWPAQRRRATSWRP